jgi:NADPH-dependent 2,4-dienoyl-CoA reductase/sulfur reductase-like enzyme/nitrite reductase/ring-hydroxylating ferredoxin subunit
MSNSPKPDFRSGIEIQDLPDGAIIQGSVDSEDAILVRRGEDYFAVGAQCTHYHAALASGIVVDGTIRCPQHHACFDLRTGEALRAPALKPIACWRVERVADEVFVREKVTLPKQQAAQSSVNAKTVPASVLIVGGGAAGLAAADMLRRQGYSGPVTMLSADDSPPYDRPNLSKDFLAGNAPADWMPLCAPEYYSERAIELVLNSRATSIDVTQRRVYLENGRPLDFGALLIATGADPVRLSIPGSGDLPRYYLRSFADSRAIVEASKLAKRVVVVGASFIGLEVAASLRERGIDVHVVGPEHVPLERVMGREVGAFVRELHESHGVVFHLGNSVTRIGPRVTLSDASALEADFVVLGVGVRPAIALAEQAGLAIDRGIAVDEYLETSAPNIFAAGDVARWPDLHSGDRIRVEHWVVAERQGQVAALNMLGRRQPFDAVPFFWSQHYDVAINYVGHAENWDAIEIEGALASRDCAVTYRRSGRTLAVATLSRDLESLRAEHAMESVTDSGMRAMERAY